MENSARTNKLSHATASKIIHTFLCLIIWLLAALFFLCEFFLRIFIGIVAHQIISDLKLTAKSFALVGSAYYLTYAIMQVPVDVLADKFGIKHIMIFAALVGAGATFYVCPFYRF